MNKTGIAWCDMSWNPTTGCSKVSQGCKHCYAERIFQRPYPGRAFTDVRTHPDRLDQPLRIKKPQRIFVNSMSDLFHEAVSWEFLDAVFAVMALCQGKHTFQILTKRPRRMRDYFGQRPNSPATGLHHRIARRFSELARNDDVQGFTLPLPNVWLGVSVEDQETANERIPLLLQTPATKRFVSYEPALSKVDFRNFLGDFSVTEKHRGLGVTEQLDGEVVAGAGDTNQDTAQRGRIAQVDRKGLWDIGSGCFQDSARPKMGISWVIVGGESGQSARDFDIEWARSTLRQCRAAGVPCFVKQLGKEPYQGRCPAEPNGSLVTLKDRAGADPSEWPEDLRIQEFPR